MIVADLTADRIGQTMSFPVWPGLGYCRRGQLTFLAPTGQGTTTLVIGDHIHICPDNARVDVRDCGYEWFGWLVMLGVAPGFGIHVTVGLKACVLPVVLTPISDFPGAFDSR